MRCLATTSALIAASCLVAASTAATAATIRVQDPAGDGLKDRALDMTSIRVANRDHAIVTTVGFVRAARGDLAVRYMARGDDRREMAMVASIHRGKGDVNTLYTRTGEQPCSGLKVTWDHETDRAVVRLPSRCFRGGDYGAVHVKVITEIGSDADLAPKSPSGRWVWTPWVARG